MSDSGAQPTDAVAVGARIAVISNTGSRSGDTEPKVGIAVENYADTVIDNPERPELGTRAAVDDRSRRRPSGLRYRGRTRTRLKLTFLSPPRIAG
ncbi:hypothetical protein [Rhodococcus globerulus]|uniref:hypothetical protein n=1 Tax=Rhodococcus globerulus TaxID=33008 RepID=UPI003019977D